MESNYDKPNEYQIAMKKVCLVERNSQPNGIQLLNLNNVGKHQADDIISLAKQIELADVSLKNKATGKLTLILEQIQFLQNQAQTILQELNDSQQIHMAACNFRKIPGNIYHLYARGGGGGADGDSGQKYLSMLSPNEWGQSMPNQFLGSYRLEIDQTWTPIDKLEETNKKSNWANNFIITNNVAAAAANNQSILKIKDFEN